MTDTLPELVGQYAPECIEIAASEFDNILLLRYTNTSLFVKE